MTTAREYLAAAQQRAERSHRMTCSDPDDPNRATTYSETARIAAFALAVLDLANEWDEIAVSTLHAIAERRPDIPAPGDTALAASAREIERVADTLRDLADLHLTTKEKTDD